MTQIGTLQFFFFAPAGIKEYVRDWRDSLYDDVRCANTKVHTTACVTLVTRELEYGYVIELKHWFINFEFMFPFCKTVHSGNS